MRARFGVVEAPFNCVYYTILDVQFALPSRVREFAPKCDSIAPNIGRLEVAITHLKTVEALPVGCEAREARTHLRHAIVVGVRPLTSEKIDVAELQL